MKTATELMKNISSNLIRAKQYEQDKKQRFELRHLLWVLEDTNKLLFRWYGGENEIEDSIAATYATSLIHIIDRIHKLIISKVE